MKRILNRVCMYFMVLAYVAMPTTHLQAHNVTTHNLFENNKQLISQLVTACEQTPQLKQACQSLVGDLYGGATQLDQVDAEQLRQSVAQFEVELQRELAQNPELAATQAAQLSTELIVALKDFLVTIRFKQASLAKRIMNFACTKPLLTALGGGLLVTGGVFGINALRGKGDTNTPPADTKNNNPAQPNAAKINVLIAQADDMDSDVSSIMPRLARREFIDGSIGKPLYVEHRTLRAALLAARTADNLVDAQVAFDGLQRWKEAVVAWNDATIDGADGTKSDQDGDTADIQLLLNRVGAIRAEDVTLVNEMLAAEGEQEIEFDFAAVTAQSLATEEERTHCVDLLDNFAQNFGRIKATYDAHVASVFKTGTIPGIDLPGLEINLSMRTKEEEQQFVPLLRYMQLTGQTAVDATFDMSELPENGQRGAWLTQQDILGRFHVMIDICDVVEPNYGFNLSNGINNIDAHPERWEKYYGASDGRTALRIVRAVARARQLVELQRPLVKRQIELARILQQTTDGFNSVHYLPPHACIEFSDGNGPEDFHWYSNSLSDQMQYTLGFVQTALCSTGDANEQVRQKIIAGLDRFIATARERRQAQIQAEREEQQRLERVRREQEAREHEQQLVDDFSQEIAALARKARLLEFQTGQQFHLDFTTEGMTSVQLVQRLATLEQRLAPVEAEQQERQRCMQLRHRIADAAVRLNQAFDKVSHLERPVLAQLTDDMDSTQLQAHLNLIEEQKKAADDAFASLDDDEEDGSSYECAEDSDDDSDDEDSDADVVESGQGYGKAVFTSRTLRAIRSGNHQEILQEYKVLGKPVDEQIEELEKVLDEWNQELEENHAEQVEVQTCVDNSQYVTNLIQALIEAEKLSRQVPLETNYTEISGLSGDDDDDES